MAKDNEAVVQPTQPQTNTWIDKLEHGEPLNKWDEVKADADWLYTKRLRDEKERQDFEEKKKGTYQGHPDVRRES